MKKKRHISEKVPIRSEGDLSLLRKSGQITARAIEEILQKAVPGISLEELDDIAEAAVIGLGGQPAFKNVPGYYWTTCLNVNEGVVHGIPGIYRLKPGDLLSVDLGAVYKGWYTDAAWTILINGEENDRKEEKIKFLKAGEQALKEAVSQAKEGFFVGDISAALQTNIEKSGYGVVKSLSGHGVGRSYHEAPEIPGFGRAGTGIPLKEGMVLAIEAIYTQGSGEVFEAADGWTVISKEGVLSGLFEVTVVVRKDQPEVITPIL